MYQTPKRERDLERESELAYNQNTCEPFSVQILEGTALFYNERLSEGIQIGIKGKLKSYWGAICRKKRRQSFSWVRHHVQI